MRAATSRPTVSSLLAERPDGARSWIVAASGAVAMVFTFGTAFSYGVFFGPFSEEFGISPLGLSPIFGVMLFGFFIGAGVITVLGAHYPPRRVLLAATALTGLLGPAFYVVEGYVGLLVVLGLLGVALGTVFVITAAVVPTWFDRRRGLATGVIFTGNGFGLFVMPPAWQLLIDERGVRSAFLVVIGVTAVAFLLASAVCRHPPWIDTTRLGVADLRSWLRRILVEPRALSLLVGVALTFAWFQLLAAYAVELYAAFGLDPTQAALAFGAIGGISIFARLTAGYVADRVGYRRTFVIALGSSFAGLSLLLIPTVPTVLGSVLLTGLGLGATATLYVPLLLQSFDPERSIPIVGLSNVSVGVVALSAPPLGIGLVTLTGSFAYPLVVTMVTTVAAMATIYYGSGRRPG